jgi:hypothetical protein
MRLGNGVVIAISILAASLVGCGGSTSTPVVNGSGGASGTGGAFSGGGTSGTGGAFGSGETSGGSGTGGSVGAGSGGEAGNPGSGGAMIGSGGGGGQPGELDAAPPQDATGLSADAADAPGNGDAAADSRGGIANCTAGARCRTMRPEPTCMASCPGGTERTCICDAAGIVVCAACPRPRSDAGTPDAFTSDGSGADASAACPAGVRNGGACPMDQEVCRARCPGGPRPESCVCTNRTWRCVARCL